MVGYTVTLTTLNTNYNLRALVIALNANFVDVGDFVIQGDDDAGAQVYKIGGPATGDLTASNCAETFRAGDFTAHYKSLAGIWARCDTSGKKLNIQVIR